MTNIDEPEKEFLNSFNIEILESILDDDRDKFYSLVTQINNDDSNYNQPFKLFSYKLPAILSSKPTYSSLCSLFGSEKCLHTLTTLFPDGYKSCFFNTSDKEGRQPIHFACIGGNLNILRTFYQEEFDFEVKDNNGMQPCHYCAMSSTSDSLKYLWMKGIDVIAQRDNKNMTPLHFACMYGNIEIVKFFFENIESGCDKMRAKPEWLLDLWKGTTPLHLACENGNSEIVNYILSTKKLTKKQIEAMNSDSQRPIDCAIENGYFECVKLLIQIGKSKLLSTDRIHVPLVDASAAGFKDIVSYLLKQSKININAANSKNEDALFAAVTNDHLDVAQILIENGIASNYNNFEICKVFLQACQLNNMEIIYLLDEKLKIPYGMHGYKFMEQAIFHENKDLILFLLDQKCTFQQIHIFHNFKGQWTPFMTFLKEKGFDFKNCTDKWGNPLIIRSIEYGNMASIKKLIDEGLNIDEEMIYNYNCVHKSCEIGKIDLFNFLMNFKPRIKDVNQCLIALIDIDEDKFIINTLKMAQTLVNQYDFDLDKTTVLSAINKCKIEFLMLFASKFPNFNYNDLDLQYENMISSKFIPIFHFLENHCFTFQQKNLRPNSNIPRFKWRYLWNCRSKIIKKCIASSVHSNMTQYLSSDYDIQTLLILIRHAKKEDLIYSTALFSGKFYNVIDILLRFQCFDSILVVYEKLDRILYPKQKSKDEFTNLINESANWQLIEFLETHEEEIVNDNFTARLL